VDLDMNGLLGRMQIVRAKERVVKAEILLLGGHHTSIERMASFTEYFSQFGDVVVPDLPGFGGMASFYEIGQVPTFDSYADYLAAFMKLRYKKRRVIIVGLSFSVPVAVKTLQKYPELQKKVDILISLSGFTHYQDFKFGRFEISFLKGLTSFLSWQIPAYLINKTLLRRKIVEAVYKIDYLNRKNNTRSNEARFNKRVKLDAELWVINDFRTAMRTYKEMFKLDLCSDQQMNVPIFHVMSDQDQYFHKTVSDQHFQIISSKFQAGSSIKSAHVPHIDATLSEIKDYIPAKLHKKLQSGALI